MNEWILTDAQALDVIKKTRKKGQKIAWTNGCFDLFHYGHLHFLKECATWGDILFVGVNSDASVRQLKGTGRPIFNENHRAQLVASIIFVDYVIIFSEPSPLKVIQKIRPDVYIKGADYNLDTINQEERRAVEAYGGQIAFIPYFPGFSTTQVIENIVRQSQ